MKKSILTKDKKYTFSDYFELNHPTRDILGEFGYRYGFEELSLPHTSQTIKPLDNLRRTYVKKLPHISVNSEMAKRAFYISPLLLEVLDYIEVDIDVEYPLDAGENLSGHMDYLIKSANHLVVIEAKKGDLEKGFNQLAVELIALDKYEETPPKLLFGAITLGDIWRLGVLYRQDKLLKKDMNAYVLPADLERLFSILLGILEFEETFEAC